MPCYALGIRLVLRVPAGNTRGPLYMDQVLAAIHQADRRRLGVTLAFARIGGEVALCCRFPAELYSVFAGQLYAHYPDANLTAVPEECPQECPEECPEAWTAELFLEPDLFPLKRYSQFEDSLNRQSADPLTAILTALAQAAGLQPAIEITVRPARPGRRARAQRLLRRLARPFFRAHPRLAGLYVSLALSHRWPLRLLGWLLGRLANDAGRPDVALDTSGSRQHDREEDLQGAGDKLGRLLFETHIRLRVGGPGGPGGPRAGREAVAALGQLAAAFGQFNARRAAFRLRSSRHGRRRPAAASARGFLLSTEELATLWHPATATVRAPTMTTVLSREAEPPATLPTPLKNPELAILGEACFRGRQEPCGILPDDRRRHCLCVGKTGTGKTTLLRHLLLSDILENRGAALLDPHGDVCESVLAMIPRWRTNDVVLFDAGDSAFPVAFNPLHCPRAEQRHLVASGILSAFKKVWGQAFWGPRLEHVFRNALLSILEVPDSSLLGVLRILSDAAFRLAVLARVADPAVRSFWDHEFASWHPRFQAEAVAPVANKIGAFATSPLLRNIIGQGRSTIDLRAIMDQGKVLLVNLSKGRIGDDASCLLGSFLVTAIQLAAMSRADLAEERRRDFFLYIDEFGNFATESFATILSEARKYRLSLTVANQFLAQMEEGTRAAVFGNVGTMVVFQVGVQDAEVLADQLGGDLTPGDLLALPRFHSYCRLLIDGHPSRPFSLRTLAAAGPADTLRSAIVRRTSRHRYGRPAERVEREIRAALMG